MYGITTTHTQSLMPTFLRLMFLQATVTACTSFLYSIHEDMSKSCSICIQYILRLIYKNVQEDWGYNTSWAYNTYSTGTLARALLALARLAAALARGMRGLARPLITLTSGKRALTRRTPTLASRSREAL